MQHTIVTATADGVALSKKVGGKMKCKFAVSKPLINKHDMMERN